MSVTTTANARLVTLRQTLADYELHHSEVNANPSTGSPAPGPNPSASVSANNPPNWDRNHRRVPPYRPVRHENYDAERNTYNNNVERAFVWVMLNGVGLQSVGAND